MVRLRYAIAALAIAVMSAVAALPAAAISLDAARTQGLVGETRSGYLAPVRTPSGDVQQLIESVNAKRRDHYRRIASQNGVGIEEVGRLSAEKIINGLPGGAFYQGSSGGWQRK